MAQKIKKVPQSYNETVRQQFEKHLTGLKQRALDKFSNFPSENKMRIVHGYDEMLQQIYK